MKREDKYRKALNELIFNSFENGTSKEEMEILLVDLPKEEREEYIDMYYGEEDEE